MTFRGFALVFFFLSFFFVVDPALWKHQQFLGDLFTYFVLFGYFKYQQKYQLLNI